MAIDLIVQHMHSQLEEVSQPGRGPVPAASQPQALLPCCHCQRPALRPPCVHVPAVFWPSGVPVPARGSWFPEKAWGAEVPSGTPSLSWALSVPPRPSGDRWVLVQGPTS